MLWKRFICFKGGNDWEAIPHTSHSTATSHLVFIYKCQWFENRHRLNEINLPLPAFNIVLLSAWLYSLAFSKVRKFHPLAVERKKKRALIHGCWYVNKREKTKVNYQWSFDLWNYTGFFILVSVTINKLHELQALKMPKICFWLSAWESLRNTFESCNRFNQSCYFAEASKCAITAVSDLI